MVSLIALFALFPAFIQATPCPAGTQVQGSPTTCQSCVPGLYSPAPNTQCTICHAGTYSGTGQSICTACSAGSYSANDASTCTNCGANTYSAAQATTCTACPAGSQSATHSATCVCNANYWGSGGVCAACPASSTSPVNSTACSCNANYYGSGSGASFVCTACPSGSTSASGQSTCTCNGGYKQSGSGSTLTCTVCAQGLYSSAGATACTSCPTATNTTGYGTSGSSSAVCTLCVGGYYGTGPSNCAACPAGSASTLGSSTCTCNAGYHSNGGTGSALTCTACAQGSYSAGGAATSCTACNTGTTTSGTTTQGNSQSACTLCAAGYTGTAPGACTACAIGYYSAQGATACSQCAAGTSSYTASASCTWSLFTIPSSNLAQWTVSGDGSTLSFQTASNIYVYNLSTSTPTAPVLANTLSIPTCATGGSGAAMSSNGQQMIQTALGTVNGPPNVVNAYSTFAPSTSTPQQLISDSDLNNWYSVASSDNGAVVAAIPSGDSVSFVDILTLNGGVWSKVQISLTSINSAWSPASVAISGDGTTVAVGVVSCLYACGSGSVAIWSIVNPTSPTLIAIVNSPNNNAQFGDFVSVSNSTQGITLVVGDDCLGYVYIFTLAPITYSVSSSSTLTKPSSYTSFAQGVDYAPQSNTILVGGATSSQNQFALISSTGSLLFSGAGQTANALAGASGTSPSPAISHNGKVIVVSDATNTNLLVFQTS